MKKSEFKNLMKEIFREVIQEELLPLFEDKPKPKLPTQELKENKLDPMRIKEMLYGDRSITTETLDKFIPRPVNTMAEGSALPEGNVSEDDIMKLLNPHGLQNT